MVDRHEGLTDEAREVEDSTPGVSVTGVDDTQVRMEETSDTEQTPAGDLEERGEEPQISLDELKALKADLENTRRRMVKEQSRLVEYATKELVKNLMPVIDHFHLAIEHGDASDGVKLAFKELMEVLGSAGMSEIEVSNGAPFDPEVHHALTTMPDPSVDVETVKLVHRRGYRFKDHVLRAPEVVVAQPTQAEEG